MSKLKFILTFLIAIPIVIGTSFSISYAQYPSTDIWLLDFNDNNGKIILSNPINITNREGYDNQPAFSPDGKYILFSSMRDGKQTDIYKYDIATKQTTQFCNTPESEFSPTFMPDGKHISSVLIEKDSTQRLWKFPIAGGPATLVFDKVDSVGYHLWISKEKVALFILTNPFTLQIADIKTQQTIIIDDSIGRCTQNIPKVNSFSYTVKKNDTTVFIRQHKLDSKPNKIDYFIKNFKTINKSEDYSWLNNNTLVMGSGSMLYKSCINCYNEDGPWKLIINLKQFGIDKIGRIAISPHKKRIALVTTNP